MKNNANTFRNETERVHNQKNCFRMLEVITFYWPKGLHLLKGSIGKYILRKFTKYLRYMSIINQNKQLHLC